MLPEARFKTPAAVKRGNSTRSQKNIASRDLQFLLVRLNCLTDDFVRILLTNEAYG